MHSITADWQTLMYQASATASIWFGECLKTIDLAWENAGGVKGENPDRIQQAIALAAIAAQDFHSTSICIAAEKIARGDK